VKQIAVMAALAIALSKGLLMSVSLMHLPAERKIVHDTLLLAVLPVVVLLVLPVAA